MKFISILLVGARQKFLVLGGSGSAKNVAKYHIPKMNTTGMPVSMVFMF